MVKAPRLMCVHEDIILTHEPPFKCNRLANTRDYPHGFLCDYHQEKVHFVTVSGTKYIKHRFDN